MFLLNDEITFPNVKFADQNGLLAIGGDLIHRTPKIGI